MMVSSYRKHISNAPHTNDTIKIVLLDNNMKPVFSFKNSQSPKPELSAMSAGVFPSLSLIRINCGSFLISSFAVDSAPERIV